MKPIQIAQRRGFTAYLDEDTDGPKLHILFTDKSKAPVTLGPDDYVPGYEPTSGTRASTLTWLLDDEKKKMKPEVVALAEKFSRSGELFTKSAARTKFNLESALEYHLGELDQVCDVLELIENSDPMISSIKGHPSDMERRIRQLMASFELIINHVKEHARKASEIYSENQFKIDGDPVVPDIVKNDYIFNH